MKKLIRHILKEETEDSDFNSKGIDIAINIVKKSHPYIIGWELDKERLFVIDISIICDIEKLKKFYNSDLKPYYIKYKDELYSEKLSYAPSVLEVGNTMHYEEKYQEYKELKNELNDIYEMLPNHLIIKDRHNDPKELDPDKFMYK
jgi:hypothetical protein